MTDQSKHELNEPLSAYGQPLNFEQVWLMFQETNKQFQETDRRMKETDRQIKETSEQMKETEKQMKETDRKLDKLSKLYGGISSNNCDVAEEFFRRGLESRKEIYGIAYEQVGHLRKSTRKLQGEYDIVLYNGDKMMVIEVKYKLHPDDVTDFVERRLPNFIKLFPEYSGKQILGGVAGMSVPVRSSDLAQKHGLLVLTQSGDNISVLNPKGMALKSYSA